MEIKDKKIFCDLDGVLANFSGYFYQLFNKDVDIIPDSELWNNIEKYGKSNFFAELPWMPDGKQLWSFIIDNFLDVKILSALGKSDKEDNFTSKGKLMWLNKNIPDLPKNKIRFVVNKHQKRYYAKPGFILIDDTTSNIDEWNAAKGIGILHKSSSDTIKVLEQYVY